MTPLKNIRMTGLIAILIVAIFAIAACDDDDGFRPDSPDQNGRTAAHSENPQSEDTLTLAEGEMPGRQHGQRVHGIWPQVWSQHAPDVKSWEYKVNCGPTDSHLEPCFLSDLTSVAVTTPSGEIVEIEKDFNTNDFSGEVTRRWVRYGPPEGSLPEPGDYVFSYFNDSGLVYEQVVPYDSGVISYPTNVDWKRSARDIVVTWDPPAEASEGMHYKALIWQVDDTPEVFVSDVFVWDSITAVLKDVPLIVGGKYSLNVAIYFDDGYAYSEYVIFEWPEPGDTGY